MAQELRVAVVAGVLSFIGATVGTYVSSYLEEQRSTTLFMRQLRAQMPEKRISIIEQCTRARSKSPRAKTLTGYRDLEEARIAALSKTGGTPEKFAPTVYSMEMQREFAQIQSDQLSCVQMAALLFGPDTNKAALDMTMSSWSDPSNEKLAALFKAMTDELTYFKR